MLCSSYSQTFKNLGQCQQCLSKGNSIDLISKQEAPDADSKAIQYYFIRNVNHAGNERMLFVLGEVKENIFNF